MGLLLNGLFEGFKGSRAIALLPQLHCLTQVIWLHLLTPSR
jgi:hypothetical protein